MSGVEHAHEELTPLEEEPDPLVDFIQDASDEFATRLYTLVGQTFGPDSPDHTSEDLPRDVPEDHAEPEGHLHESSDPPGEKSNGTHDAEHESDMGERGRVTIHLLCLLLPYRPTR